MREFFVTIIMMMKMKKLKFNLKNNKIFLIIKNFSFSKIHVLSIQNTNQ